MIGRMSSHQIHQSGLDVILDAQTRLSRTQEELASGKRLLTPADDPVAAAQIQSIRSELTRIETLQSNVTRAARRVFDQRQPDQRVLYGAAVSPARAP